MPQLFIDLDGVLADTHKFYYKLFGKTLDLETPFNKEIAQNIRSARYFYLDQPLIPDARDLWIGCNFLHECPIILTGVRSDIPNMVEHKREWVRNHFGARVPVICCKSHEKSLFCNPGDILVDDRLKYRDLWIKAGGVFVHHTSAQDSLAVLAALLPRPVTPAGSRFDGTFSPVVRF